MAFLLVLFVLLTLMPPNKITVWRIVGLAVWCPLLVHQLRRRTGLIPTSMTGIWLTTGATWALYDVLKLFI